MSSHHKKYFYCLAAVICMFTHPVGIQAQVSIETNQPSKQILPTEAVWFFDNSGKLSFNEIKDSFFTAYDKTKLSVTGKTGNAWARFELNNRSGIDQEYVLQANKIPASGGKVLFFADGEGNLLRFVGRPADSPLLK